MTTQLPAELCHELMLFIPLHRLPLNLFLHRITLLDRPEESKEQLQDRKEYLHGKIVENKNKYKRLSGEELEAKEKVKKAEQKLQEAEQKQQEAEQKLQEAVQEIVVGQQEIGMGQQEIVVGQQELKQKSDEKNEAMKERRSLNADFKVVDAKIMKDVKISPDVRQKMRAKLGLPLQANDGSGVGTSQQQQKVEDAVEHTDVDIDVDVVGLSDSDENLDN